MFCNDATRCEKKESQIRGCCYAADWRAFVFGAMHIIARSPASSSELLIGVPSEFDTNIYTTDAHQGARKHTDPFQPPPVCKKFPSVRFVTARAQRRH